MSLTRRMCVATLLLLSAVATGCVSSPRAYRQAVMPLPPGPMAEPMVEVEPEPFENPHDPPGVGPAYGPEQRGEWKHGLPRRSEGRVRSAEDAPVIYAADEPANDNREKVVLLALTGQPKGVPMEVWSWCVQDTIGWFKKFKESTPTAAYMTPQQEECFKAQMNMLCVMEFDFTARAKDPKLASKFNMDAFSDHTGKLFKEHCKDFFAKTSTAGNVPPYHQTLLNDALIQGRRRWSPAAKGWKY